MLRQLVKLAPHFQSAADCGMVARKFEASRRREVLSFQHHRHAIQVMPISQGDLASLRFV
jgi:hypothetical protein